MDIPFPSVAKLSTSAPWQTSPPYFGGATPALTINGDTFTAGAAFSSLWDNVLCGPDCDMSATMDTGVAGDNYELTVRATSLGSTFNGYAVRYVWSSGAFVLVRYVGGAQTSIASTTLTLNAGDGIGIRCVQDTIQGYTRTGTGPWTRVLSVTDATFKTAGYGCMYSDRAGGRFSNVQYGDLAPMVVDPYGVAVMKSNPNVFIRWEDAIGTSTNKALDWSGHGNGFANTTNAAFNSTTSPIWGSPGRALINTLSVLTVTGYNTAQTVTQIVSVECWQRYIGAPVDWPIFVNRGWVGDGFLLYGNGSGHYMFGVAKGGSQYYISNPPPSGSYADSRWHHLVATFDGQNAKIYADGQLVSSGTAPDTGYNTQTSGTYTVNSSWPTSVATSYFAEFAVYNRVLTPDEVMAHYNAGKPYYGMVL